MQGRALAVLISMAPFVSHAATQCSETTFGATTKRYLDRSPPNAYDLGLPEGEPAPRHAVSATFVDWGCSSSFVVDLDTGRAWRRLRCAYADSFQRSLEEKRWEGARIGRYGGARGEPGQEAVKEGHLGAASLEDLVCLGNDAWGAGKWGELPQFDDQGRVVEPEDTPVQPSPHGHAFVLLKDGVSTRTLTIYRNAASNPDSILERTVREAVLSAIP